MSKATLDFYYPAAAEKRQNFFGVFLQFQIGVDNGKLVKFDKKLMLLFDFNQPELWQGMKLVREDV